MKQGKGFLQKVALVSGVVSFILAAACGVWLYLRIESVGADNPVSASLMATIFFFCSVGVVLTIIGKSDLPSFKL
ncbi:MAG: hemerythrin family protein [Gammaproteobacteria bacterium]|nr:hemerythrin family protein [Gammaproteobacteria bacterium]MCW8957582.1 hemerythrin family protein [Gammaproteobacteria bacterium]MCW8972066.1 hemerythrin family protein [Gammaproteobacteria bacterium]MCW8993579.1 hemerythrin family protein [Gammaproteobacteria bacterium]